MKSSALHMRRMVNALHTLHAIRLGVEMGFFDLLAKTEAPLSIRHFVEGTACAADYVTTWVRAMQSAGIIDVNQQDMIRFSREWREVLVDHTSTNFMANLPACHMAVADMYDHFPTCFRKGTKLLSEHFDERLIRGISRDSIRFANVFMSEVLERIPEL